MSTVARVRRQNSTYANQIRRLLWEAPRWAALTVTLEVLGEAIMTTYHDSSQAAYNWHVVLGGQAPEFQYYKGEGKRPPTYPVGYRHENRTFLGDTMSIATVAAFRADASKAALKSHLFQGGFSVDRGQRFGDFSIVNSIPWKTYQNNADLANAMARAQMAHDKALARPVDWLNYGARL